MTVSNTTSILRRAPPQRYMKKGGFDAYSDGLISVLLLNIGAYALNVGRYMVYFGYTGFNPDPQSILTIWALSATFLGHFPLQHCYALPPFTMSEAKCDKIRDRLTRFPINVVVRLLPSLSVHTDIDHLGVPFVPSHRHSACRVPFHSIPSIPH